MNRENIRRNHLMTSQRKLRTNKKINKNINQIINNFGTIKSKQNKILLTIN